MHEPGLPMEQVLRSKQGLPDLPESFDEKPYEFTTEVKIGLISVNIDLQRPRATLRYQIGIPGVGWQSHTMEIDMDKAADPFTRILIPHLITIIKSKHV